MLEHGFCFYFVYCHFSLGVKAVVKMESFLQRHQLPSAPSGHYWCIVGTAWRGQWLVRTMKLGGRGGEEGGATQRTRPLHDGKEQRRKQMLPQRTHRRGESERETADVSLSLSLSVWCAGFVFSSSAAGKKRQQLYLLLTERCFVQSSRAQQDGQTFALLCCGQASLLRRWWDISRHFWDQFPKCSPQKFPLNPLNIQLRN